MTIVVHQRPLEQTRSSGKACKWVAVAIANGRTYTATSRMATANDIARQLMTDGVPDAPMHVYSEGLKGCLGVAIVLRGRRVHLRRNRHQAGAYRAVERPRC